MRLTELFGGILVFGGIVAYALIGFLAEEASAEVSPFAAPR